MSIEKRIADRTAVVGVIGLGYVGLPLAHTFHAAGFPVVGFDTDPRKIEMLDAGESYLEHLSGDLSRDLGASDRFQATTDTTRLAELDAILICVPTPLGRHLEPDLSYVEGTTDNIARHLRAGQLVVLESTTYPGTTREVMLPRLEAGGLKCGTDFYLAFSPEREDPGRPVVPRLLVAQAQRVGSVADPLPFDIDVGPQREEELVVLSMDQLRAAGHQRGSKLRRIATEGAKCSLGECEEHKGRNDGCQHHDEEGREKEREVLYRGF